MRKRPPPRHAVPVSYQVNWEIQALDQAVGFLRDDPIGVAALWDTVSQLADEPRPSRLTGTLTTANWNTIRTPVLMTSRLPRARTPSSARRQPVRAGHRRLPPI